VSEQRGKTTGASNRYSGYRRDVARREPGMKRRIIDALDGGTSSVPAVAEALGLPASEVMWWMMGMVRYGELTPTGKTDENGYRTYRRPGGGDS
jgi:hypothetical protein